MVRKTIWVLSFLLIFLLHMTLSEEEDVKSSLVNFMEQLAGEVNPDWGWNMSSDPCRSKWKGVICDARDISVKKIILDGLELSGYIDADSLCVASGLTTFSIRENKVDGVIPEEIGNCKQLTHLYLDDNELKGVLPDTLSGLSNLKRLDISNNKFFGKLPNLPKISGLVSFLAQYNDLTGQIPKFDFSNLQLFNISFNNFTGPIPDLKGRFSADSVLGNSALCGEPLLNSCPKKRKGHSFEHVLMYSGYIIIGLAFFIFVGFMLIKKKKATEEMGDVEIPKRSERDYASSKPSTASSDYKTGMSKIDYSAESGMMSTSLVVLTSPVVHGGLSFEDLLKAPAELLGRGTHGSMYKVVFEDGLPLAVKRIRDWAISSEDFKKRMEKIDQVKHPNVLPPIAFYCSKQEKLVVYGYQKNGSLFRLLHGSQEGETFEWSSRLSVAAILAEALAFMHRKLLDDGIAHGNLKSSNILLDKNMDPCITEYGLMVVDIQEHSSHANGNLSYKISDQSVNNRVYSTSKIDIYAFGVVLLELLTGKQAQQDNGIDLARWVHSVVSEEWTAEVFDKALVREGASEERMVNLLQVALKCINTSSESRPSMDKIAAMIDGIKEEEEMSMVSEP
ncbi:hypothetical protein GIB67_003448 [Kingdonia uniflora]|uniref:Protein kinase domain-containing protein n=1 Tax=Kingdonia uniflora TaxID=39325 RepID=A0A7J7P9E3_9MAGN|nr:hypothetical protein GIB67_003448 [Kingdonia uniflora]